MGLFAEVCIPKGTTIWQFEPPFDVQFTKEQLEALSEPAQRQVLYYSTFDESDGRYLLSGDDDRFINHSDTPNCQDGGHVVVAVADITAGEEITLDYRTLGNAFRTKQPDIP